MPRWNTAAVRSRTLERLRDERGIALIMALGILLVLTITLSTVIYATSASARHAEHSNASQKAYALAEAGLDNALAVLNTKYPSTTEYPGDPDYLVGGSFLPTRVTTYDEGTATWSGTLAQTTTSTWLWEWRISSIGTVANPTGPGAAAVTRTIRAVVPVVIPEYQPASASSPLNWIYALENATFSNSVTIASPVYTQNDLTLGPGQASISGAARRLAVGGVFTLLKTESFAGSTSNRLIEAHLHGGCKYKGDSNLTLRDPCWWDTDNVFAYPTDPSTNPPRYRDNTDPATLGLIDPKPALTCCAPVEPLTGGSIAPSPLPGEQSQMGFWYQNAVPGPRVPCDPVTPPEKLPLFSFDTGDNTINNTAYNSTAPGNPIDLTPSESYTCKVERGGVNMGELSWNAATKELKINKTVFIDGSATITSDAAKYNGKGTIYLSGTFLMDNHAQMCAAMSACVFEKGTGSTPAKAPDDWDPNTEDGDALIIVAAGDGLFGGAQAQVGGGNGIEIKTATFQGVLIANKNIVTLTTTNEQGPMISVYHDVEAGQTGELTFPPVDFAPSGGGGVVGPPPPAQLLAPQNIAAG
jgi:Tfp pilus assembly protein PilX